MKKNNDNITNINNINYLNNNTEIIKDKEDMNNNNINSRNDSLLNSAEINIKPKVPEEILKI